MQPPCGWNLPQLCDPSCVAVCLHLCAAAFPVAMNIDPSTGAAPSLGQGLTFAINPCSEEYHFAW
jgi:hypothetical protein